MPFEQPDVDAFVRWVRREPGIRTDLAEAAVDYMRAHDLDRAAAAKAFGVNEETVHLLLQGELDQLSLDTLAGMLDRAGCTLGASVEGVAPQAPRVVSLRHSVVVFLDLLGFRQRMMDTAADADAASELLAEYDRVLNSALDPFDDEESPFDYKGFTDNFVLSIPLFRLHPEESVGWPTVLIAGFQLKLACQGWFVRGGMTLGPYYMDRRIVFGAGLIDAYELESKTAVYPRVILNEEALAHSAEHLRYYADPYETAPQNSYLVLDEDERAFVNYLYEAISDGFDDGSLATIAQHRDRVNAVRGPSTGRVREKYDWVAAYHNYFCRTWLDGVEDSVRDPLIIADAPDRAFSRLIPTREDNQHFRWRGDVYRRNRS